MKKIFLLSALMICNLSFAETVRVNIASKNYPDGMSAEQYQQRLILQKTQYTITVPDTKAAADARAKARAAEAAKAQADNAQSTQHSETREKAKNATNEASAEAAQKKAQAKTDAANAAREYRNKLERNWNAPMGKSGEKAMLDVTLNTDGSVRNVVVKAADPTVKASAERAVRAAAPYPVPSNPEVRSQAMYFRAVLTVR